MENTKTNDSLFNTMRQHHPLRDIEVKIQDNLGSYSIWKLIGKARFNIGSGKFTGYEGKALPLSPISTGIEATTDGQEIISLTSMLTNQLVEDALIPLKDMLGTVGRLARNARRTNDHGLLSDIRTLQEDCYKLRDIVGDGKRISDLFGGKIRPPIQAFDVFKIINIALDEDLMRHGGMPLFQLKTQLENCTIRFNRELLQSALSRLLEISRTYGKNLGPIDLFLNLRRNGALAILAPVGFGEEGLNDEDLLLPPEHQLRHHKRGPKSVDKIRINPAMGLSAMCRPFKELEGDILTKQDKSGLKYLILSLPVITPAQ